MTRSMNPHPVQRRAAVLILALALVLACAATAAAAPHVEGTFPLKSELQTNNKLVAGPEGNIWVTLPDSKNDVAKVSPGTGSVEEIDLGAEVERPLGIAVGPEGNLWITQEEGVAKFSPADPKDTVKFFKMTAIKANSSIVMGPDNNMWVATEENVIRFSPGDPKGTAKAFPVPNLNPRDIDVAGPLLVVADSNQVAARIVTMTTAGVEKDYATDGGSQGVAGSPGGQVGFSMQLPKTGQPEQVGLITPPNPAQTVPQPDDPFGTAFGSDGAYWIVRAGQNGGLARLTSTGQLTLLGGFPAERTARQIAPGPNNTLWVTTEKNMEPGAIVRVSGLEPPVINSPAPETKLAQGPKKFRTARRRARVKFRFSSTTAGAGFECALTKARKGKKNAAKPHFKACKSPKSYRLTPGRYRFSVRAVSGGVVDATPATRSFRVIHKRR